MTVIAPALMAALYNTATGTQSGDTFYAWVLTFSMIFVVITAPALGVIADKMPIKKKLLKWYTVAGILFTALGCCSIFRFARLHYSRFDVYDRYDWIYGW